MYLCAHGFTKNTFTSTLFLCYWDCGVYLKIFGFIIEIFLHLKAYTYLSMKCTFFRSSSFA